MAKFGRIPQQKCSRLICYTWDIFSAKMDQSFSREELQEHIGYADLPVPDLKHERIKTAGVTRIIMRLLDKQCDYVSLKEKGGCYISPATDDYINLIYKLEVFVHKLGAGSRFIYFFVDSSTTVNFWLDYVKPEMDARVDKFIEEISGEGKVNSAFYKMRFKAYKKLFNNLSLWKGIHGELFPLAELNTRLKDSLARLQERSKK